MTPDKDDRRFRVLAARPDQFQPHTLELLVNRVPRVEDLRWRQRGSVYVAEQDGFVEQLYYEGPGEGFGGRTFHLTMGDGSTQDLIGPFDGGANTVKAGFPELEPVDVILSEDEAGFKVYRGTHYAGVITGAKLAEIHQQFPDLARRQQETIAEHDRRVAEYQARLDAER